MTSLMINFYIRFNARFAVTGFLLWLICLNAMGQALPAIEKKRNDKYIVVYKKKPSVLPGKNPEVRQDEIRSQAATTMAKYGMSGQKITQVFATVLNGFALDGIADTDLDKLRMDDQVAYVVPDAPVFLDVSVASAPMATSCSGPVITFNGVPDMAVSFGDFGSAATVTGPVVLMNDGSATPTFGCEVLPAGTLTGKIVLIDRGTCQYGTKALRAQNAGAIGVIIANNVAGDAPVPGPGTDGGSVTIPVMTITLPAANALKASLLDGPVTATMDRGIPDGTSQCTPWGITRVQGGLPAPTGKRAWIIDSGIDQDHPDLNVNQTLSKSFYPGLEGNPDDQNGHGTHVAGTIGAYDNTIGVIGVAAGAEVVAVRVFPAAGGSATSTIIAGMNYVAGLAAAGDVVNMSLGGDANKAMEDAVLALSQVCKVVVSAGNNSRDANFNAPSRVNATNIYTVSAVDISGKLASFSNYGNAPVDYAAPGVNVASTWLNGGYNYLNGTSMAAPHVAGLLLLGDICSDGRATGDPDGRPDRIAVHFDPATAPDMDGDSYSVCEGDLDDNDPSINPGIAEVCGDGIDNDSDGEIDEGCCPSGLTSTLYVNATATGGNSGLSWPNAFTSLQAALAVAKKCAAVTQIWVAKGTYYPSADQFDISAPANPRAKTFVMRNNLAIYGGFAGNEGSGYDLTQRDLSANLTTLSGEIQQDNNATNNAYHVILNFPVHPITLNETAVLDGFVITGGRADATEVSNGQQYLTLPNSYGAAVLNYGASPGIKNCLFLSNTAYQGGAIANFQSDPVLNGVSFIDNFGYWAASLYNDLSDPVILNCEFQLNRSEYSGIMENNSSNPVITNSSFTANNATTGLIPITNSSSSPIIRNSIFWGNSGTVPMSGGTISHSIVQGGWAGAGSNNLDVNPLFVQQPVIGGNTIGNLSLQSCSPAINAGDPTTSAAIVGTIDLAGNPRLFGAGIDMGSYELQSPIFSVSITANPGLTVTSGGSTTLSASGALSYVWSTTETTASITVSPTTATDYSVTGVNGACTGTASVTVNTSPLPVTLISFLANKQPDGSVRLDWVTANEVENAYFELERSTDLRQVESLAKVAPDVHSAGSHSYRFVDETPYRGTSYYRLKQVDRDGRSTTYTWKSVVVDQTYAVFPNPVLHDRFMLRLDEPEKAILKFYSVDGKVVPLQTVSRENGVLELKLPPNTATGVYLLRVEERGQSREYRLVVD